METDADVLDVLGSVLGVGDYETLKWDALDVPLFGRRCHVISLENLIKTKESLGREKDLLTAKELRATKASRNQS